MQVLSTEQRKGNFREVELGYDEATGKEEAGRCLNCGYCCECYQCVEACGPGAVTLETHRESAESVAVEVGSIILAPGFHPFDPSRYDTYRYSKLPNVVTSMEFERILSASGPTMGHLVRPVGPPGAQEDRLAPVRGIQGHQPVRPSLLLFGLLHVCHQGGGDRQGACQGPTWIVPSSSWTCGPTGRILRGTTTRPGKSTGSVSSDPAFTRSRGLPARMISSSSTRRGRGAPQKRSLTWWSSPWGWRPLRMLLELAEKLGHRPHGIPGSAVPDSFNPVATIQGRHLCVRGLPGAQGHPPVGDRGELCGGPAGALLSSARNTLTQVKEIPSEPRTFGGSGRGSASLSAIAGSISAAW